jgi:GrpB-like predicted nucleotidyltransferase (UPF0157 family)
VPTPEEITDFTSISTPAGADPWVQGKGPSTDISIAEPDPAWPSNFERLASSIRQALGDVALSVEHVGSTSVPDLPAKPIIDIDITVRDPDDEDSYIPALLVLGLVHTVREPWWHGHRALRGPDPRCNIHVFAPTSPEVVRHRLFRDWLKDHPEDRAVYAAAKREASAVTNAEGGHVMDYNARKEEVVHAIYDRIFRSAGWR